MTVPRSERKFLRRLEGSFPGSEWIDHAGSEPEEDVHFDDRAFSSFDPSSLEDPIAYVVVGGMKYDLEALTAWALTGEGAGKTLYTGQGRGAETKLREIRPDVRVLPVRKELYGKKALTVQPEELACMTLRSPLGTYRCALAGEGSRAKTAYAVFARCGREPLLTRIA